jgi:hypothetical protein
MERRRTLLLVTVLAAALVLVAWGYVLAGPSRQVPDPEREAEANALVDTGFWYQGILVDDSDEPIGNANLKVGFRLYDAFSGGEPLGTVTVTVNTDDNGLFNEQVDFGDHTVFNGQYLWLGVMVEGEDEMTPRHALRAVPYALSLRPGAVISKSSVNPSLHLVNDDGAALYLEGTLQSSQYSYFFFPGISGYEPETFYTLFRYRNYGGNVGLCSAITTTLLSYVIPMPLPGLLYGQNVTIDQIVVYYQCDDGGGGTCGTGGSDTQIRSTTLYRADSASSFVAVYTDPTIRAATSPQAAYTLDNIDHELTPSSDDSILALNLSVTFADSDDYIWIQGIRVRVEHE